MKKMRIIATTVLAAMLVCICLLCTGCYGSVEGTYKFKKATIGDNTYEVGDYYGTLLATQLTEDAITATITEDGKYAAVSIVFAEASNVGTWEESGAGKITVKLGDKETEYKCNGKTLKIVVGDNTYVLEKVEEDK